MDSIDVNAIIDVVWAVLMGHMVIGLAWAQIPSLSQLYAKTATAYAAVAMEAYVKAKSDESTDESVLQTHERLARIGLDRANVSLDYYASQRKFFINILWVTELRWTFGCLRGIERLSRK